MCTMRQVQKSMITPPSKGAINGPSPTTAVKLAIWVRAARSGRLSLTMENGTATHAPAAAPWNALATKSSMNSVDSEQARAARL